MYTAHVLTAKPYDVTIGENLLENCGALLKEAGLGGAAMVIADSNVAKLYLDRVLASLNKAGIKCGSFVFEAGEGSKNLDTLGKILESFAKEGLTRKDFAIALGGGVTGDLTGFAAGCYMRGIDYVQFPTTVLATVDSSVGGKTAVNLPAGKNLAGLFIQPRAVICDINTFQTLSPALFGEGCAEAVKTAIIGDGELFKIFESNSQRQSAEEIVKRCVGVKAKIVALDEREGGLRKLLNLGHTPAHAIEKLSGYTVSHGRAVAAGLVIMARAAAKMGMLPRCDAERIERAVLSLGLDTIFSYTPEEMAKAALGDKKRSGSTIDLVFPEKIGACSIVNTPMSELENIFKAGMEAL